VAQCPRQRLEAGPQDLSLPSLKTSPGGYLLDFRAGSSRQGKLLRD
jgi:hypothetical protein